MKACAQLGEFLLDLGHVHVETLHVLGMLLQVVLHVALVLHT
jgi:hypothetical protein